MRPAKRAPRAHQFLFSPRVAINHRIAGKNRAHWLAMERATHNLLRGKSTRDAVVAQENDIILRLQIGFKLRGCHALIVARKNREKLRRENRVHIADG